MVVKLTKKEINEQIKIWQEWVDRQTKDKFILNPNKKTVERLARGVLENEKTSNLKFCPCRMTLGIRQADLKLVCPCNFKVQKMWKTKGECWCSLFVKSK